MSTEQEPIQAPVMFDMTEETSDSGTTGWQAKEVVNENDLTQDSIMQGNVESLSPVDSSRIMKIQSIEEVSAISPTELQMDGETIEEGTSKPSRELKLLLALSKEANLDTNIAHKRKSVDPPGRSDILNKRRHSTSSNNDSTAVTDEPHPDQKTDVDEIVTDETNSGASVDKEPKPREGKRAVEGAVDENGIRNRKLSNAFVTFNNEKKDPFCWQCHHGETTFFCKSCPRSFHQKCLKQSVAQPNHWLCPECVTIMQAENLKQRSSAMRNMTLVHLCGLLKFALRRMLEVAGCEPFIHAVNDEDFPDYGTYIIRPMDVTRLEKNIKKNLYGSPQAFEADAKWILHNSIIFNSYQSKLTSVAKSMLKICKQEMLEIENCSTCYLNANTKKKTWFVEVCPKPHMLVWAKLKGFPYWPAKAMKCNPNGMVDVRFFGAHDRAWVHYKECFLFSLKDPNSNKQKKNDILESVKELQLYVDNLKKAYSDFRYADYRVPLEPENFEAQLKLMLPSYPNATRSRKSLSKISKSNGSTPSTEESQIENELSEPNVKKLLKSDESSEEDNVSLDLFKKKSSESLNSPKAAESQLARGGSVRMRGGFTNTSGKLKIIPKLTPESSSKKRLSTEEHCTPPKLPRMNSDTLSDSTEVDTTSTMESDEGRNVKTPSPTCKLGESSENSSPSQRESKISDRIMKKLTGSETSADESPPTPTRRSTETDIFLETFKTKGLTMLEKITELSADTEIFETDQDQVNESNDNTITKQEQCDDLLCTEVDLEEKHNLLLHDVIAENDSFTASSVNTVVLAEDSHSKEAHMDVERRDKNVEDCTSSSSENAASEKESNGDSDDTINTRSSTPPASNFNNRNQIVTSPHNTEQLAKTFSDGPSNLNNKVEDDSGVSILNNGTSESEISTLQRNMITMVSVEEIKKKKLDARRLSGSQGFQKSILENHLSNIGRDSTNNKDNGSGDIDTVVIKSEPSSDDERSDKKLPEKPKVHKIRTRSKVEEKPTTFKIVDNLSKVIDDVATHYSIKHANDEIRIAETPKRKEIFIKPLSSLQELKQRARKSFPTSKSVQPTKSENVKLCKSIMTPVFSVRAAPQKLTVVSKPSDISNCTKVIITNSSTNSLLPPNQPISYTPSQFTPLLSVIQSSSSPGVLLPPLSFTYSKAAESQSISSTTTTKTVTNANILTKTIATTPIIASSTGSNEQTNAIMEEVRLVSAAVPENVSKAINDIMLAAPPKLKPRPPGPLNTHFDDGIPSSAGVVTSKVNSISHRLNDYFRGMLVELLHEAGTVAGPEAEITRLKLENEELKHKHSEEMLDIKKNISSILKDMQKSLTDEKERAIEETRAACEIETLKRVEEAKSKQWCACCSKEAQFYCCWNTSYCDYPCQQKHWSAHMSKCTQQIHSGQLQSSGTSSSTTTAKNPLVLRQTSAPKGFKAKTIIGKPTKVLLNNRPTSGNKAPFTFARATGSHITLVESTPGNYELLGSGGPISVGGKIIANFGKKLSGSVLAVTSTANSSLDLATVKKIAVNPAQTLPATNKPTVID